MTIRPQSTLSIRSATNAGEVQASFELAARVFGPNYFEAHEAKRVQLTEVEPISGPTDLVVAVDGRAVVGLIRLVARRLRFGADLFKVAGITSVCVAPSYRGRGIGVDLMNFAMRESRRRGDELSVLFARRAVDGWYPKFGFIGVGQHVEFRLPATGKAPPAAMWRGGLELHEGFDQNAVAAYSVAYASTSRSLPGSFVRSRDWWRHAEHRVSLRKGAQFLSLTASRGRVVGYALVEQDRIWELSVAAREASAAAALVVADRQARGYASVALQLHPSHAALKALYRRNHTLSVRKAWDGGHMTAVLTAAAARRLATAGVDLGGRRGAYGDICAWPVWSPLDEF